MFQFFSNCNQKVSIPDQSSFLLHLWCCDYDSVVIMIVWHVQTMTARDIMLHDDHDTGHISSHCDGVPPAALAPAPVWGKVHTDGRGCGQSWSEPEVWWWRHGLLHNCSSGSDGAATSEWQLVNVIRVDLNLSWTLASSSLWKEK